jgi:hypothetical protein
MNEDRKVFIFAKSHSLIIGTRPNITIFIFFCTVKKDFFQKCIISTNTVLGFHSNYRFLSRYHLNTKNVTKKQTILKMLILLAKKSPFFGVPNVNFYSAWLFFEVLLLFHIPYIYRAKNSFKIPLVIRKSSVSDFPTGAFLRPAVVYPVFNRDLGQHLTNEDCLVLTSTFTRWRDALRK